MEIIKMLIMESKFDKQLQYVFNNDGGFICVQLLDRPYTVDAVKYKFDQGREIELLERNSQEDLLDELYETGWASRENQESK